MATKKETVITYSIPDLTDKEYSYIKNFIRTSNHGWLPPMSLALKMLTREDVLTMYNTTEVKLIEHDELMCDK